MFERFECKKNVELKNFSTVKIGGRADYFVFPKNVLQLKDILAEIRQNKQKYFILGNGSNVLFSDDGYRGVVISLKYFDRISRFGNSVRVGAGTNLFALNVRLKEMGLSGIEWSYGIPATLGGLIFMNGGSFGHEICEFVEEVVALKNGRILRLKKEQIEWGYRKTNLQNLIVLSAKLNLNPEKSVKIAEKMDFFLKKKRNTQPLDFPSLGSVFKVINGEEIIYPAKIIDNLGLKGVKIGGAEVSQKHAGFIVNSSNATCQDFLNLMNFLQEKLAKIGVFVESEIIVLKE